MGGNAVKEWGPVIVSILPQLNAVYQRMRRDHTRDEDDKKAMKEALKLLGTHQHNLSYIIQNQAQMKQTVEGLRLLVHNLPANQSSNSVDPASYQGGPRNSHYRSSNITVTMTQQELHELITMICRVMISERGELPPVTYNPIAQDAADKTNASDRSSLQEENSQNAFSWLMQCGLCGLEFNHENKKPILLPDCGHTFCKLCISHMSRNPELECPTCGKMCRTRPENLPTNFTVLQIISEFRNASLTKDGERLKNHNTSRHSQDEDEDESLRLARQLQEEEIRKTWAKGRKFSYDEEPQTTEDSSRTTDGHQESTGNLYHSARVLMNQDENREEDLSDAVESGNGNKQKISLQDAPVPSSHGRHRPCDKDNDWKRNDTSNIHEEYSSKPYKSSYLEQDLEEYMSNNFSKKTNYESASVGSHTLDGQRQRLARSLQQEEQERRRRRRFLKEKEDLELAMALSLSLTDDMQDKKNKDA